MAKLREGLVDFDDLIRRAAALLRSEDIGRWIAYKLDRRFDHILVDEAQDTSPEQWQIVKSLASEFFSDAGARCSDAVGKSSSEQPLSAASASVSVIGLNRVMKRNMGRVS